MSKEHTVDATEFFRPAFAFTCEECGRDNLFELSALPNTKQNEELADELELPGRTVKHVVSMPGEVKCRFCDTQFKLTWFKGTSHASDY